MEREPQTLSSGAAGLALTVAALLASLSARAELATVAVAANFLVPMQTIAAAFEDETGHELVLVPGSTGQLYAQILNGAPFDVFLAADAERPALLADDGLAVAGSRFTYARGRLVLWSADPGALDDRGIERLADGDFRHLAIASPELAPYGAAARQVLERLELWEAYRPRIAVGQSIGQAFAMAATGNAELGLVALSQALAWDDPASHVTVPPELHAPIEQDAVLLGRGADNAAAIALVEFLQSAETRRIIGDAGYF